MKKFKGEKKEGRKEGKGEGRRRCKVYPEMKKGREGWTGVSLWSPGSASAPAYPASTSESKYSFRSERSRFPPKHVPSLLCQVLLLTSPSSQPPGNPLRRISPTSPLVLRYWVWGCYFCYLPQSQRVSHTPDARAKRDLRPSPSLPFHRWGNWSPQRSRVWPWGDYCCESRFLDCKRGITQWAS